MTSRSLKTRQATKAGLLVSVLLFAAACGRETFVYPDNSLDPIQVDDQVIIDDRSLLPTGFYDQSVNHANADVALDGATQTSLALRLQTYATVNEPGGFNGTAIGNRALLGLSTFHDQRLYALDNFSFDTKIVNGALSPSLLLQVDLKCDGTSLYVVEALTSEPSQIQILENDYLRMQFSVTDQIWRSAAAAIIDRHTQHTVLLPENTAPQAQSLSTLLGHYPNTCLRNAPSGNDELPRSLPTAALLISLGRASNSESLTAFIQRISIGTTVFDAKDWSTR